MNLILLPTVRGSHVFNAKRRVAAASAALIKVFNIDPIIMYGSFEDIKKDLEEYLTLPIEDCGKYDKIKRRLISVIGNNAFCWLRDYTNFLVRNNIMIKKNKKDFIAQKIVETI